MNAADVKYWVNQPATAPRFDNVSCSQCGKDCGPGNHGFSHCVDHVIPTNVRRINEEREADEAFERVEALRLYQRLLKEADWSYPMAQDHHKWQDGVKQFDRLYSLQALVDADGALWRAAAEASKAWAAPQPRVVTSTEPIDLGFMPGNGCVYVSKATGGTS